MNHTSGPWIATVQDTINNKPAYWFIRAGGGVVGDVQSVNPADAALIAAAPDLLAALQQCADDLLYVMCQRMDKKLAQQLDSLTAARAAIAKALGE